MISWVGEKWLDSYGKASILSFRIILRSRSSQIGGQVTDSKLVRLVRVAGYETEGTETWRWTCRPVLPFLVDALHRTWTRWRASTNNGGAMRPDINNPVDRSCQGLEAVAWEHKQGRNHAS